VEDGIVEENMAQLAGMACKPQQLSDRGTLNRSKPQLSQTEVMLLGNYNPQGHQIIKDPYQGTTSEFEEVYQQYKGAVMAFLESQLSLLGSVNWNSVRCNFVKSL
jgi:hypothetical protein